MLLHQPESNNLVRSIVGLDSVG